MFRRLLIANRGEIALRVIRTCRELGVESVAVYSDADETEPHVIEADRAQRVGPASAHESYLAIDHIIDAARRCHADAIHPGYGFLSENPEFADACRQTGITFVGPSPAVIVAAGSKIEARRLAASVDVAVVPGGVPADQTDAGLDQSVRDVGFPALLKAAAGGGGKGMRVVRDAASLVPLIHEARREAEAAFGDGTIYVERLLERPRHIEVQLVGDHHGHLVHLFERECSIQRRYQKVVEESPSPALSEETREQLTRAALDVGTAAGYDNVGTVEFLVEGSGRDARFYFLEMNTRLQVEHGITELCTGVDLVRAQIEIAAGQPVSWNQASLTSRGHAIECRLYAEDPAHEFLPQAGHILLYREPRGPGLRIDSGVREGSTVPVHYDPLLAKLMAYGETREHARRRAAEALRRYAVLGVRTNLSLLRQILDHPRFIEGQLDTGLLAEEMESLSQPPTDDALTTVLAAAAVHRDQPAPGVRQGSPAPGRSETDRPDDPWTRLRGWRLDQGGPS